MLTVSVPTDDDRTHLLEAVGDAAEGLDVLVWDGSGDPPPRAERIEFFLGLYNVAPPAREVFEGLPELRVIQLVSAGVEPWLPVVPDGVALCNGRGIHGSSTAELAVAGMLALLRRLPEFREAQQRHDWERGGTEGLDGSRVLIIGAGDIGVRIAAVADVLDAETTLVARTARDGVHALADLPTLLPQHEIVVIAVPQTPDTARLVDAEFLAAMPDHALLVNIARGGIVDTDALLAELTSGRLRAFLDVTDPEPLPADHPLWDAPNLLITPHVGGGTTGWTRRAHRLVAAQIARYQAGEELANRVLAGY